MINVQVLRYFGIDRTGYSDPGASSISGSKCRIKPPPFREQSPTRAFRTTQDSGSSALIREYRPRDTRYTTYVWLCMTLVFRGV